MLDKLLIVHRFLNEIKNVSDEDELAQLFESYKAAVNADSEDAIYQLLQDGDALGKEILFLKSSVNDADRAQNLAKLSAEERVELAEVEAIISENRFDYHFQPIVSAVDGSVYSYDALMRPQSDMRLSPYHIIKYAELTGRLYDIERATFWNVLHMIDSDKARFKGRKVFINSIPEVTLKGNDTRTVGELLIKHSDTAVVELTEQADSDDDDLNAFRERFMKKGIEVAIDDFGTGYSNMRNLLRYMPNYVKIDRSLISNIQDNPKKRYFVREVIDFCHNSGIQALAEGVETSEELHTMILMGVDLIQGYYTAKPAAEILDSLPHEICQEIRIYQQERQEGREQQIYSAEAGERVHLDKLANDSYKCILVEKSEAEGREISIIGLPTLDTEIYLEIAENFEGRILLENVHLAGAKNRSCVNLGRNSNVVLELRGENKLDNGGILVPEGAKLTLEGDGMLEIRVEAAEYFGIGNDPSSRHGDIIFNQSGVVSISASGKTGVCIGSGLGGNITISRPGKFALNVRGNTGIGIGSLYAGSKLDISNCAFEANLSIMKGVAMGALTGNADVRISRSSTRLNLSGKDIVAIGTISGENAEIRISDAIVTVNAMGYRCTCVGSLEERTFFKVKNASFQAMSNGEQALPFGGLGEETKIAFTNAEANIMMDTNVDLEKYLSAVDFKISGGRTSIANHGQVIDLKAAD